MKKLFFSTIISFIMVAGLAIAPISYAYDYHSNSQTYNDYNHAYYSSYQSGNDRLEQKYRANIERGSKPNLHYDNSSNYYYTCSWEYNKYLDKWICEKDYSKVENYLYPLKNNRLCPYGYKMNYGGTRCLKIYTPINSHLNTKGDGWECNAGYHLNYTKSKCLRDVYNEAVPYHIYPLSYSQPSHQTYHPNNTYYHHPELHFNPYYTYCMSHYRNNPNVDCERFPEYYLNWN